MKPIHIDTVVREVSFIRGKSTYRYGTLNVQSTVLQKWVGRRVRLTLKEARPLRGETKCARPGCGRGLGLKKKDLHPFEEGWYCSDRCRKLYWKKHADEARKLIPSLIPSGKQTLKSKGKPAFHPNSRRTNEKSKRVKKQHASTRTKLPHRRPGRPVHRARRD